MTRALPTRLLAALCMLAFGLSQAVSSLAVRCVDNTSGEARFALACVKATHGDGGAGIQNDCCGGGEADRHNGDTRSPCNDEPIGQQEFITKVLRTGATGDISAPSPLPALLALGWSTPCPTPTDRAVQWLPRPSDSLVRLRTVILRV